MSANLQYGALVCDIGDVLFSWTPPSSSSIPRDVLRKIFSSPAWHDHECGKLSQKDFHQIISQDHNIPQLDIVNFFDQARSSLRINEELLSLMHELKNRRLDVRIILMSNIPQSDYDDLLTRFDGWDLFDDIYISAKVGFCKPDIGFYDHIVAEARLVPSQAVFLDDKTENVAAASSLGFHGVVYDNVAHVTKTLRELFNLEDSHDT